MEYHKTCKECVLNHDCLFQKMDNVEDCKDVFDEIEKTQIGSIREEAD